jgi:hypothetical protein
VQKYYQHHFQRSTMGTAGQWKLIMSAWSYQNKLATPKHKVNVIRLVYRLLELGYAKDVYKLILLLFTLKLKLHGIFPNLDISVFVGILTYVVDTRDNFKFLTAGKDIYKWKKRLRK